MCFAYVIPYRITSVRICFMVGLDSRDGMTIPGLVGFIQALSGTLLA
jgi:hypothetical protein